MFICDLCKTGSINHLAFLGKFNGKNIKSCFKCFIACLEPFPFDSEQIYNPIPSRDIHEDDSIGYFTADGQMLGELYLKSVTEGFISFLKEDFAENFSILSDEIFLVVLPHDYKIIEDFS